MFRDIVFDYLNSVKYSDWSIISILEYIASKRELYIDMLDCVKDDIYTALRSYEKSDSINKNAKKRMTKILNAYDKGFSAVEVSQFKNKLRCKAEAEEHKTALRMKHTSACTIEELKGFHANKRIINQLIDEDDNDRSTEEDANEGELDEKNRENEDCAVSLEEDRGASMMMGNKVDHTFMERLENQDTTTHTKYWILSSGTKVQEILAKYVETIPESQKCSDPAYWGILDLTGDHPETKALFSAEDWAEMVKSFHQDVRLSHAEVSDAVCRFFDEVHKIVNDGNNPTLAFNRLMPESIAKEYGIALTADDRREINTLMLTIMTYAENLGDVDLPVSEAGFDNSFPNMLMKRFLDRSELKMDVGDICCWASAARRNQGRSIVLRARVGQKCDFRGSLKHSNDKLEAIVGLRSGGLPEAHRKKVFEDHVDLAITMRDILHRFFASNNNAPDDELHRTFVLGVQSWGWVHYTFGMDCRATNLCRFGRLATTKLPATVRMLATLEAFYVLMLNVKQTLKLICDHANDVALLHSRAHRKRRTEEGEEDEALESGKVGVPKEAFAEMREAFQALSKSEKDIFLMAQLKAVDGGSVSASRRLKNRARVNKRTQSVIFLPAEMSYRSVHRDLLAGLEEDSKLCAIKYVAFCKLWHQLTPRIQIMSPRTDLCDTCQCLKNDLQLKARKEEDLLKRYKEHLAKAKLERNYYNKNTNARKVHLFGIQDEAVREQINYVLDENELLGKGLKGTL
ncbi:hypothetical protein G9A89_010894 [Geosiphon pyriformis]|nr:hypothetical protein G9A89_010894 [Geosiphon pyriformis]